jgi:predicted MFS family arabinose efflux permease
VFTYVAPLITEVVGLQASAVGPLLLVYGITGALGLVVAGSPLARRADRAMLAAMAVAAAALVVLGLAPGVLPSLLAFAVWGLAFGAIPPLLQTRLLQATPARQRDAASALYTTAFNIGIGGGALVGAVLFERVGVQSLPFVYAAVLVVVGLVLVGDAARRARQARATTAMETGPVRPSTA